MGKATGKAEQLANTVAVRTKALETAAPGAPHLPAGRGQATCQQAGYFPVSLSLNTDEVLIEEKREVKACEIVNNQTMPKERKRLEEYTRCRFCASRHFHPETENLSVAVRTQMRAGVTLLCGCRSVSETS